MVDLIFTYNQFTYSAEFYVSSNPHSSTLLGLKTVREIGLINSVQGVADDTLVDFGQVFQGLGKIKDYQHTINLDPTVKPVVCAGRKIPIHMQTKLKKELERLESLGIIEKCNEPTDWVSPIAIVAKPNDEIRVCLDPMFLNKAVKREHYTLPSSQEIFSKLGKSEYFSVVDARNGFHQIELSLESSKVTTFITPFGRYAYKRLPFGLTSSAEVFHKVLVEKLHGLEGVEVYIDDILVHGENKSQHDHRLRTLLQKCKEINLTLKQEKSQICKRRVTFLGHIVSNDGLSPKRERAEAILRMKSPTNKTEVMRLLGMLNYVAKFCRELAIKTEPMRQLIRKDFDFVWSPKCEQSFSEIKQMIANAPILKRFNKDQEVTIQVDASAHALGATIMQNEQPVEYATKPLTSTQTRYSQIEKEMLGIYFGCKKFHYYVYGGPVFTVQTDHKPLVSLIEKPIEEIASPRLKRMIMHLRAYDFRLVYKKGSEVIIADTLSRASYDIEIDAVSDWDAMQSVGNKLFLSTTVTNEYKQATKNDKELQTVSSYVIDGWPKHRRLCGFTGRKYWQYRDKISIHDELLFLNDRLIVPLEKQKNILVQLHQSHMGVNKAVGLAKTSVFWIGLQNQLEDEINSCKVCQEHSQKQHRQPMIASELPQYPFQVVSSDIFHHSGCNYLVIVDHFTKWYTVEKLSYMHSKEVLTCFDEIFTSFGFPEVIKSDNGSQYTSGEFKDYCAKNNITHQTSSPGYPQSNGMAEKYVHIAKQLVKKCNHDQMLIRAGLRKYRNTPIESGLPAPAILLQGRYINDGLPRNTQLYIPATYEYNQVKSRMAELKSTQKMYYDRKAGKELDILKPGETVRALINDKWVRGSIASKCLEPRSYVVHTPKGNYRRTRTHIRKTQEPEIMPPLASDNSVPPCRPIIYRSVQRTENPSANNPTLSPSASHTNSTIPFSESGQPYRTRAGRTVVAPKRLSYDKF